MEVELSGQQQKEARVDHENAGGGGGYLRVWKVHVDGGFQSELDQSGLKWV